MFRKAYKAVNQAAQSLCIGLIKAYRTLLSPLTGNCCRFHPSCSCYAEQAISRFGVLKGGLLTVWRLLRCHPLHPGGFDPIPKQKR